MPTEDSSNELSEPCFNCGGEFTGNSPRWQAAITDFLDRGKRNLGGSTPKVGGYHWVNVCTPCFWHQRYPRRASERGPLLEGEIR